MSITPILFAIDSNRRRRKEKIIQRMCDEFSLSEENRDKLYDQPISFVTMLSNLPKKQVEDTLALINMPTREERNKEAMKSIINLCLFFSGMMLFPIIVNFFANIFGG